MFWIDHVGVVARDLDESIDFYRKLFGEPIDRVEWRGEDAANVARLMGRPEGLELDAVFFRIPQSNTIFELVHFRNTAQEEVTGSNVDVGATHIGLYVESIDDVVDQLGLETAGPPMELPIGPYRGGRSVYLKDPSGANLQLMEVTRRPGGLPIRSLPPTPG